MLVINDPILINRIPDPAIRSLVQQRFSEVCAGEPYDYDIHGYMVVVEPGVSVEALEREFDFPILRNPFNDTRHGEPDFTPSFEALEEHGGCYEMVFIFNDEGFGVDIFIPKQPGVDGDLLAMCAEYAIPAQAMALAQP
ncbi:hypothetical protein [Nitrosomonas communis]|uniref:Uncharacterized protein n=1 Tax=Nitrosomonas communis TaxID=44574 RepID=A0A1I4TCB1_9PROT|nr:hypothetical protein [Nitrosomonas communis]SFM74332.1 hypothetical protein SAMN05421863_104915 [Nitrosomonas communis]